MTDDIMQAATDKFFFVDGTKTSVNDYVDGVDQITDAVERTGNIEIAAMFLRSASALTRAVGIAKAKLYYWLNHHFVHEQGQSETWLTSYLQECGVTDEPLTIERYIKAWGAVISAPPDVQDNLLVQPMKNLVLLGSTVAQGYEIEEDEWKLLSSSKDEHDFRGIINERVKKVAPKTGSLQIKINMETGDIYAWSNGEKFFLGYLDVSAMQDNPTIDKAVNRIIDHSGIMKENN